MLKYDHQLTEVKSKLPGANRILIVLPQNLNSDNLAAGLSLYLSLKATGKKVDIVSNGTPLVAHSNLFGIGEIKNNVPSGGGGNFIISLDGVVDTTGTMQQVPALEKLDWYPEGSKLNLVFHVAAGQRFEPTNIASRHEEAGYDLTFVFGTQSLNELGNLFISNSQYFAQSQVINIDINPLNAYFGFANVIDPQASSLSEIIAQILPSLTLSMDRDISSNIITGIYSATTNLTQKVNPDTFMVISQAVQVGGSLPNMQMQEPASEAKIDYQPQEVVQPEAPAPQPEITPPVPELQEAPSNSLQSSPFIVAPQDINIPLTPITAPVSSPEPQINTSQFQFNQMQTQSADVPAQQVSTPIQSAAIPAGQAQGFDLRQIFQIPQMASGAVPANPQPQGFGANPASFNEGQVFDSAPTQSVPDGQQQTPDIAKASQEERPMGEFAHSPNPEMESTPTPDWLVPKIFKGGNLG